MSLADTLNLAWQFAAQKHQGQQYAGHHQGEYYPYVVHLGQVFQELACAFALHPVTAATYSLAYPCAILHDTVEDTDASFEEIEQHFGIEIAQGVLALSKLKHNEKGKALSKSEQMLDSLHRILQQPDAIAMVKMADRIVNLSPPPFYWEENKIASYKKEAIIIYQHLHKAHIGLAQRLQARIDQYPFTA